MDDTSNLYHNLGEATFEDATRRAGLGVENRFVSWGAGILSVTLQIMNLLARGCFEHRTLRTFAAVTSWVLEVPFFNSA
jgi:hypothetical protein